MNIVEFNTVSQTFIGANQFKHHEIGNISIEHKFSDRIHAKSKHAQFNAF